MTSNETQMRKNYWILRSKKVLMEERFEHILRRIYLKKYECFLLDVIILLLKIS
jgi:hypothetical protein